MQSFETEFFNHPATEELKDLEIKVDALRNQIDTLRPNNYSELVYTEYLSGSILKLLVHIRKLRSYE
ncbi:hypothetical protein [Liberibacter crescens]|nr:hypothetical protein [Liberibacter crescens]